MSSGKTISALLGSPPGYVGRSDPDAWLSTRLQAHPDVVLLLDEMDKAHTQLPSTLLLAVGNGRLTDRAGTTASLRECVVVLTTNTGSQRFRPGPSATPPLTRPALRLLAEQGTSRPPAPTGCAPTGPPDGCG